MNVKPKLRKKQPNITKILHNEIFVCVCVCMYKMGQISKEAYKKCEVEIIDKGRYFCINRRDLEVEPDYEN